MVEKLTIRDDGEPIEGVLCPECEEAVNRLEEITSKLGAAMGLLGMIKLVVTPCGMHIGAAAGPATPGLKAALTELGKRIAPIAVEVLAPVMDAGPTKH